jgi:thioredoxin-dependent peroxiredoxin
MGTTTAINSTPMPLINDTAPLFTAETTQRTIPFHEWIGNGWAIVFAHPKDFTPVCTTELGSMARLEPESAKRNTKIIGLSVDPVGDHERWVRNTGPQTKLSDDRDTRLKIAKLYAMSPAETGERSAGRTAADNATVRTFVWAGF